MILTLFVTQFSSLLFQAPKTYAVLGNFTVSLTNPNQPAVDATTGIQAQKMFTLYSPGLGSQSTNIA